MKLNPKRSDWNEGKVVVRVLLAGAVAFAGGVTASGRAARAEKSSHAEN